MVKTSIKAVIWDLDGTLIDFKIDFLRARQEAFIILRKHSIRDDQLSLDRSIIDTFKIVKEEFKLHGLTTDEIKQIIEEVDEKVIEIENEAALNASMINGIDKVLDHVKMKHIKQAIYTYNHSKNAKKSLEKVNLLHYFDVIAGRDSIDNPKPHPDHLNYICDQLGVKTSEVVVIGDHYRDIQGALNAGAHSIAIHSKLAKGDTLNIANTVVKEKDIPSKLIQAIDKLIYS